MPPKQTITPNFQTYLRSTWVYVQQQPIIAIALGVLVVAVLCLCVTYYQVKCAAGRTMILLDEERKQRARLQTECESLDKEINRVSAENKQLKALSYRFEEKLHLLYPGLRKYEKGEITLNTGKAAWLKSITLTADNKCLVKMENTLDAPIGPVSYRFDFLTEGGYCIGSVNETWMFDKLRPGERRTDKVNAGCNCDDPVYFIIRQITP